MSWDFSLLDPVSNKTLELPMAHMMTGGTYRAEYDEEHNEFFPAKIKDAWLNVTYNYSPYYYEASKNDYRFYITDRESEKYVDNNADLSKCIHYGIRCLNNRSSVESVDMLNTLINNITNKYKNGDEWITSKKAVLHKKDIYGNEFNCYNRKYIDIDSESYNKVIDWYEGKNNNYWIPTAANALSPLIQLRIMAELRPDGIWRVE